MPAFTHKNWKAREEICLFLQQCLLRYGVVGSTNGQLYVSKFVSSLVTLVSDPNVQVRDTSMTTLVEIYKHVGDRLRNEILRKHANMQQHKYGSISLFSISIIFHIHLFLTCKTKKTSTL